jgi:hypothetical protein
MSWWRWVAVLVVIACPVRAAAQGTGSVHRLEVTGAIGYFTGAALGTADATLRANAVSPQTFTLFTTDTTIRGSVTGELRVGTWLSRRIGVEGRLGYGRPDVATSVHADVEGAAAITVVERIDQFVIDAGILFRLDEMRIGQLVPFAGGGVGYLRQVHEGLALIEDGHVYHLGGGVIRDLVIHPHGIVRAAGLRADARVYFLSGGVTVTDRTTTHGSFTGGLFVRF